MHEERPGPSTVGPSDTHRPDRSAARDLITKGDKVAWNSSQGEVKGKVVRKATTPTRIKGHKVAASKDNPEYIVESAKTGARAAHKPEGLRKL